MQTIERMIIEACVKEAMKLGFLPYEVNCEGDTIEATTVETVVKGVSEFDCAHVFFRKDKQESWVFFVLGNGIDVLSDWNCRYKEFNDALERVCDAVSKGEDDGTIDKCLAAL